MLSIRHNIKKTTEVRLNKVNKVEKEKKSVIKAPLKSQNEEKIEPKMKNKGISAWILDGFQHRWSNFRI